MKSFILAGTFSYYPSKKYLLGPKKMCPHCLDPCQKTRVWSACPTHMLSRQLSYRAREIFSKFLSSKATTPVNIDSQAQLADDILSAPHPDMFKEQQLQVTARGTGRGLGSRRAAPAGTRLRGESQWDPHPYPAPLQPLGSISEPGFSRALEQDIPTVAYLTVDTLPYASVCHHRFMGGDIHRDRWTFGFFSVLGHHCDEKCALDLMCFRAHVHWP